MTLPKPPMSYSPGLEAERNRVLELADSQNHKREQAIEVGAGAIILRAANGSRWKLTVSNTGVLSCVAA